MAHMINLMVVFLITCIIIFFIRKIKYYDKEIQELERELQFRQLMKNEGDVILKISKYNALNELYKESFDEMKKEYDIISKSNIYETIPKYMNITIEQMFSKEYLDFRKKMLQIIEAQ